MNDANQKGERVAKPITFLPIEEKIEDNATFVGEVGCEATLQMTIDFFQRVGFVKPWIGYYVEQEGRIVGSAAFKGPPICGSVEIAYGTMEPFRSRGIGTAVCRRLVELALQTDPHLRITARTFERDNFSARILEKNSFACAGTVQDPEDGEVWEWVYDGSENKHGGAIKK